MNLVLSALMTRSKIGDLAKRVAEAKSLEEKGIRPVSKEQLLGQLGIYIEDRSAALITGTARPRVQTERAIARAKGLAEDLTRSNEGCWAGIERSFRL